MKSIFKDIPHLIVSSITRHNLNELKDLLWKVLNKKNMDIYIKVFLFLLVVSFARSQDSTPKVFYSFKSDLNYQKTLNNLKTSYNKTKDKKLIDSIAELSFTYKDWENSIKFLQMSLNIKPNSKYFFLLGAASGLRSLEVSIFSSTKYVKIMKRAFQDAVNLEPKKYFFNCSS